MPARVRAPELSGHGGWIGVERSLSLKALRGKVVLLHFWTYSCVNCLRVLQELRRLERRFSEELVVVGVHSPKFPREADHEAVVRAVARHRIAHPVLDDPELSTSSRYGVRAWPSLVLVDPRGYVAAAVAGEGHGREMGRVIDEVVAEHRARGTLVAGEPLDVARVTPPDGILSFPGKVAVSTDGERLAIADTAHDRVLVCSADGLVLEAHTGLAQPQGVRFDGDVVVVCDTGADRVVRTDGVVVADGVASPWDLVADADGSLIVTEAGRHRLVRVRPGEQRFLVAAGTGQEGMEDGPAPQALLAQPSGVARVHEGIAFADAEGSALRVLERAGEVVTLIGQGLYDWGREDGPPQRARLQHPLGVAASSDGRRVYVADTFNSRLRTWDGRSLRTVAVDALEEPGGLDVLPDGRLVVADTNHHRVVIVDPDSGQVAPLELDESWVMSTPGSPVVADAGRPVGVAVSVELVDEELDQSDGDAVHIDVTARPASLLGGSGSWSMTSAEGELELRAGDPGVGLVLVEVTANTRKEDRHAVRVHRTRHRLEVR
ncbi:MAG: redoxin domain-containing protein [Actinomycetota bacterium]|nr:redoxin domain-containing protein [Actinomycetota bacterium]